MLSSKIIIEVDDRQLRNLRTYKGGLLFGSPTRVRRPFVFGAAALVAASMVGAVSPAVASDSSGTSTAITGDPLQGPETYERANVAGARNVAAELDHEILVAGETTETSLLYARPDGSLRTEMSIVPVRVKQNDGSWANVDYDLVELPEGGYAPKVSPADVVFSGGGSGPAVTLAQASRGLDLSWAKQLPEPTIEGATVRANLGGGQALYFRAANGNNSTDKEKIYSQKGRRNPPGCLSTWCIFSRGTQASIPSWEVKIPGTTTRGVQPS